MDTRLGEVTLKKWYVSFLKMESPLKVKKFFEGGTNPFLLE